MCLSMCCVVTMPQLAGFDSQQRCSHYHQPARKEQFFRGIFHWKDSTRVLSLRSVSVSKRETMMKDKLSAPIRSHSFKTCQPAPPRRPRLCPPCSCVISCHVSSLFVSICISLCLAAFLRRDRQIALIVTNYNDALLQVWLKLNEWGSVSEEWKSQASIMEEAGRRSVYLPSRLEEEDEEEVWMCEQLEAE